MGKIHLKTDLETRIFSRVCLIMSGVALVSLILDLLFSPVPLFLAVDLMVVLVLGLFFYLVNYKISLKRITYPFILFMMIMINLSWSVSGQGIGVGYIYFFILVVFLIITEGIQRNVVAGLVILNVVVLTIIQYTNPEFGNYSEGNKQEENFSAGIGLAFLLGLTTYVIGYLKGSYEKERQKVNRKNLELEDKNYEIEAQNEELRQFQDQIVAQRDQIEQNAQEMSEANRLIQAINQELEELVKQRTSELDELFYRSSHDFRQPLTSLMGLSYLAKVTVKDDYAMELFNKVDITTCKMDQMLGKFLMTYEINHFEERMTEPCSFGEIINDIKTSLISDKDFVNLNVKKDVSSYSLSDPRNYLLKFILHNLVDNAINFKRGDKANINIALFEEDDSLNITVEDDGLGIPKDQLNRIFDMFIRTNEASTGNGMGLYVVKKAAEKLGGNVKCESEEGKYAHFHIAFPLLDAQ